MERDLLKEIVHAHSNLNIFASIVAILEGGTIYGGNNKAAERIIKICKEEQHRQLMKYDKALLNITKNGFDETTDEFDENMTDPLEMNYGE